MFVVVEDADRKSVVLLSGDVISLSGFLRVPKLKEDKERGSSDRNAGLVCGGACGVVAG